MHGVKAQDEEGENDENEEEVEEEKEEEEDEDFNDYGINYYDESEGENDAVGDDPDEEAVI